MRSDEMIEVESIVDRHGFLLEGVNKERVGNYIKELSGLKKHLTSYDAYKIYQTLKIGDEQKKGIVRRIDGEIELCRFYFEYLRRQKNGELDKWVYLTKEQRKESEKNNWRINGDCWTKTNGKIRAKITIDRESGVMAKIELSYKNDSKNLQFDNSKYQDGKLGRSKHRKTEKGINEQIEAYKQKADEMFNKLQYPVYCHEKRTMDILNELLHIGGE